MAASISQQTHNAWYVESLAEKVITFYVTVLKEETARLKKELSVRAEEVSRLNNEVSRLNSEVTSLDIVATRLKNEINGIKRSVGFRFVRFYGSRFDQLFPDGTKRGDLRRKITQRLRSAQSA